MPLRSRVLLAAAIIVPLAPDRGVPVSAVPRLSAAAGAVTGYQQAVLALRTSGSGDRPEAVK